MSRGSRQSCKHCGVKLKMKGAWICEPCYRTHCADDIERERQRREQWAGSTVEGGSVKGDEGIACGPRFGKGHEGLPCQDAPSSPLRLSLSSRRERVVT